MAMGVMLVSVLLAGLDTAVANVALPSIAADLHAGPGASIWVVNAYQLATIATMLPLAALGDAVGHKRVYIPGLALFTLASLACGQAWSLPTLVAARVLQGVGGSAIMTVNIALIRFIFPSRLMARGLGLNATVVAVSFAVGPTIASGILSVADWPWLFEVNVPFGLVALALAFPLLPDTGRSAHGFHWPAALLAGGMFLLLVLGISEASHGAPWALVGGEWVAAVVCLLVLLRVQRGHPAPILAFDLFRRPIFALSSLTSIFSFTTQGLAFVALPFLFETVLHRSQVDTGFLMTPWSVVVAIMAPIAARLTERYSVGLLGGIGLGMLALGMMLLALLPADPSALDITWRMLVCGAGFGFFQAPNLKAIMSAVPPSRSGSASGIVGTSRMLGQSLGSALVAAWFAVSAARGPELSLWCGGAFAAVACLVSIARLFVAADAGRE
jgi:DHA2 family multidrug resistance protein-like MFS transporter